jgi:hypothetical protein
MDATRHAENNRSESTVQLVRGILHDTQALFSKEMKAAKLETKQEINKAIKASISMGVAGVVLATGFLLISFMLVFVLSDYTRLTLWASFGIVGLAYCIVGGAVAWGGKRKASQVKAFPEESVKNAKNDVRSIAQRAAGR